MANVQAQFSEFDATIRLGRFKENELLREKRDIIRNAVNTRLPAVFRKYGESVPQWEWCDHGSYDLGTGIHPPADCDFDIDQGLHFALNVADYPDPVELKKRVYEAIVGHTDDVRVRRPCVTVGYHKADELVYHVDIAIFSDEVANVDGRTRLAVGRTTSSRSERFWQLADPHGLKQTFWNRFPKGPERDQFRRSVRYLKRWKDFNFSPAGNAAPTGIGLTVAAHDHLRPTFFDGFTQDAPNDLDALRIVARAMLGRFQDVWRPEDGKFVRRFVVQLPVDPRSDLLEKMSDANMLKFEAQLVTLCSALDTAAAEVDPVQACRELRRVFGPDFPIPERKDTAKKHAPAIVSASNSA